MSNISIKPISYAELVGSPTSRGLFEEYSAECSISGIGKPNPKDAMYESIEKMGKFHVFGVFEDESLVGFTTLLTSILPHYGVKAATVESLFISAKNRHSGIGFSILKLISEFARSQGCEGVLYSAPAGSSFETILSSLKKYRHTNTVFYEDLR